MLVAGVEGERLPFCYIVDIRMSIGQDEFVYKTCGSLLSKFLQGHGGT